MANASAAKRPIEKIVRSVDFQRVLSARSCAQSEHFAVHHLGEEPARVDKKPIVVDAAKLSTGAADECPTVVDNIHDRKAVGHTIWCGCVVPKRHAKRSVTRCMMKRQIRNALREQHASDITLSPGLWIVRLRAAFNPGNFVSANSSPFQSLVRAEVRSVVAQAAKRTAS